MSRPLKGCGLRRKDNERGTLGKVAIPIVRRNMKLFKSPAPPDMIKGLLATTLALVGMLGSGHVANAAPSTSQPDVLMLVYAGPDGKDSVGLTYPKAIPHAQAKSDLQALQ